MAYRFSSDVIFEATRFKEYLENHDDYGEEFELSKEELRTLYKEDFTQSVGRRRRSTNFALAFRYLRLNNHFKIINGLVIFGNSTIVQNRDILVTANDERQERERHLRAQADPYYCPVCDSNCQNEAFYERHVRGRYHQEQSSIHSLRRNRVEMAQDKKNVIVSSEPPMDESNIIKVVVDRMTQKCLSIFIDNRNGSSVQLQDIEPVIRETDHIIRFETTQTAIRGGTKCTIKLTCLRQREYGSHMIPFAMSFSSGDTGDFSIMKYITLDVIDADLYEELKAKGKYKRPSGVRNVNHKTTIRGEPIESRPSPLKLTKKLKPYYIPPDVRQQARQGVVKDNNIMQAQNTDLREKLQTREELSMRHYQQKFETLLYVEEVQMQIDIRNYDMRGIQFKLRGNRFTLNVPGLAENRPSVLRGDTIYASIPGDVSKRFEGIVHKVEQEEVVIGFHRSMPKFGIFDVQFTFHRLPLQVAHRAVEDTECLQHVLSGMSLPFVQNAYVVREETPITDWYDKKLNDEQKTAVIEIMKGDCKPAPYLVFGPPGTGKTVTISETIKQIYSTKGSRILVCAPENTAADFLVKNLLTQSNIQARHILRFYAASRNWNMLPDYIKDKPRTIINFEDGLNPDVIYPPKEKLMEYRIIICTLVTTGRLVSAEFPKGHFEYIFIDESGHATEPECIIPIAGLLNQKSGHVVLAGDPKQLGPVIRSDIAKLYGLDVSLLERFMTECHLYQRKPLQPTLYDKQYVTKLINNYRSHEAIITVPRQLFYDNELRACASDVDVFIGWDQLPNKKFPIIFHPMYGKDDREGDSPSFFNIYEVLQIKTYLELLLEKQGGKKIRPQDIGIISPYRKQVSKIKTMIARGNFGHAGEIMVGSVEEFQGQERLIIIISTVRSTREDYMKMDIDYKLGFLKNPKRFNVAITRAKALLIVIGNPDALEKDEHWKRFVQHCEVNKALKVQRQVSTINENLAASLRNMNIDSDDEDDDEDSDSERISRREHQERPKWPRRD